MTIRWFRLRSIGLLALVIAAQACGCSGKRVAPNETASKSTDQASNALVAAPAPPSPTPIPYPVIAAPAPRDLATGQSSGKRQHDTLTTTTTTTTTTTK